MVPHSQQHALGAMARVVQTHLGCDLAIEINNSLGSAWISTVGDMTWNVVPSTPLVT